MKKRLSLVISSRMNTNKKSDRREGELIRMSRLTRENIKHEDKNITCRDVNAGGIHLSLKVFQAYTSDINMLRERGVSEQELINIAFVTENTFKKLFGRTDRVGEIFIVDDLDTTLIGADPEFLLFNETGNVVEANTVMPKDGIIGSDGPMAELRPKPEYGPEDLSNNIRKIFSDTKITNKILKYKWRAACYHKGPNRDYSIGGHIHIGNPEQLSKMERSKRENLYYVLNKVLDELLSAPMTKIDGKKDGSTRRVGAMFKYGSFGCLRTDLDRLEYRTLSGMWLMHPVLTTAVLGTAKAITDSFFKMVLDNKLNSDFILPSKFDRASILQSHFDSWKDIPIAYEMGCISPSAKIKDMLDKSAAYTITQKYLTNWLAQLKSFTGYEKYANQVDTLYEILKLPSKFIAEYSRDLQDNWLNDKKLI